MTSTDVFHVGQSWIQKRSDVCGGDACIRDTRVPVWSLMVALRIGTPEKDLEAYFVTPLSPADLRAAGAYFKQHTDEIEEAIRLNEGA